eukprot:1720025-Alexandrium_andersonii.AAC.1
MLQNELVKTNAAGSLVRRMLQKQSGARDVAGGVWCDECCRMSLVRGMVQNELGASNAAEAS